MAQSLATKSLPPPRTAFAHAGHFKPTATKSQQLHDRLAAAARRLRGSQARPFYSMTDVARFFSVAVSTVAEVFQALEREGLLLRQRGAMTVICPRRSQPRRPLRGVVAVPIWMPGFLFCPDVRGFHRLLEECIRQRDFVADLVFFAQGEDVQPSFVERVLDHHPDSMIWLTPPSSARENIAAIREAGVRVALVGDRPAFANAPYTISAEQATRGALAAWRRAGIRSVVIPGWEQALPPQLLGAIHKAGLQPSVTNPTPGVYGEDLDSIARSADVGVWFADDIWFALLCHTQPEAVARLLGRRRALVMRPIHLPPPFVRDAWVDAVLMDWARVARRLARDLGDQKLGRGGRPVVFEAAWHPRMPAVQLTAHYGRD